MNNIKWIATTEEVYMAIYSEHHEDLTVYGTCTCPLGDTRLGFPDPYIMTEWGFEEATEPIIKCIGEKDSIEQKEYDYKYFIALTDVTPE